MIEIYFSRKIFLTFFENIFSENQNFHWKSIWNFWKSSKKSKKNPDFFSGFFEFFYMDFQWKFLEISDFPKKHFRKMSKIFFLKNKFRSQKIKIFLWNFKLSHPMSRPSSSCIFGSIGPVEVFERGSYIVLILLCFLKKVGHTLLSRITCTRVPWPFPSVVQIYDKNVRNRTYRFISCEEKQSGWKILFILGEILISKLWICNCFQ